MILQWNELNREHGDATASWGESFGAMGHQQLSGSQRLRCWSGRSCIESALKKAGHCKGDITIYAIIDIFYPPKPNRHLFRGLFSIGITVRRVSRGIIFFPLQN